MHWVPFPHDRGGHPRAGRTEGYALAWLPSGAGPPGSCPARARGAPAAPRQSPGGAPV